MKASLSTVFLLLTFPIGTNSFLLLENLFNMLFQPILDRGCTAATNVLGNVAQFTCECGGSFNFAQFGFTGDVNCDTVTNSPICLNPQVCATGSISAEFQAGLMSGIKINSAGGCLALSISNLLSGLPSAIQSLISTLLQQNGLPQLCFEAQGKPNSLTFETCSAKLGTGTCGCTVCTGGQSFSIDCSTVNVLAVIAPQANLLGLSVPGPKLPCIGLDLAERT